jgi:hypothetical protein
VVSKNIAICCHGNERSFFHDIILGLLQTYWN